MLQSSQCKGKETRQEIEAGREAGRGGACLLSQNSGGQAARSLWIPVHIWLLNVILFLFLLLLCF